MLVEKIFTCIFLFIVVGTLHGQIEYYAPENLTLPGTHVYDITQDETGNMWFALNGGIVKFDGFTSTLFSVRNGLPFNEIFRISVDPIHKNKVWYFGSGRHCGYILNDTVVKLSNPSNAIINPTGFYQSKACNWIESVGEIYRLTDRNFYRELSAEEYSNSLKKLSQKFPNKNTHSLFFHVDKDELSYVFFTGDSIFHFDLQLNLITSFESGIPISFQTSNEMYRQSPTVESLFAITFSKGMLLVDITHKRVKFHDLTKSYPNHLKSPFHFLVIDNEIHVKFEGHFYSFNQHFELIDHLKVPNLDGTHNYFRDKDQTLWIPEFNRGILIIPETQYKSTYYFFGKKVDKLFINDGQLYAGLANSGYYLQQKDGNFTLNPSMKTTGLMYGFRKNGSNSTLFINALKTIEVSGNTSRPFELNINEFGNNTFSNFKDVWLNNTEGYAICTADLIHFDPKTKKGRRLLRATGAIKLDYFRHQMYVGGTFGLLKLFGESLVKPISFNEEIEHSISTMIIHDDYLWVGTDGHGVYAFDGRNTFQIKQTIDLAVRKIIPRNGALWLATNQGVKKVQINKKDIRASTITNSFYKSDGLIDDNLNDICFDGNYLYAACNYGISKINVNDPIYKKPLSLLLHIDKSGAENNALRSITVRFGVIHFSNQRHLKFSYRLYPRDKTWNSTDERALHFTHLPPGQYRFQVRVQDQHFNQGIQSVDFEILPLWWQTIGAKISIVLTSLIVLFLTFRFFYKKGRQKEYTRREHEKNIHQLEMQAIRSQMNPHFIYNSINAIQYFIQHNDMEKSENYLTKFSQLIHLFFDYARMKDITLKEEIELLDNYLQIEQMRFEKKLSYAITVDEQIDTETQILPTMILQPIVENAVNHGIFHKTTPGMIWIKFNFLDNQKLRVRIEDNGIGISRSKALKKNYPKRVGRTSTSILNERIELLNQSHAWNLTYSISNLYTNEYESGTRIELIFHQIEP